MQHVRQNLRVGDASDEKPVLGSRGDLEPVSTYREALGWLIKYAPVAPDLPLNLAARLVCDLFWISEKHLRRDLAKLSGGL